MMDLPHRLRMCAPVFVLRVPALVLLYLVAVLVGVVSTHIPFWMITLSIGIPVVFLALLPGTRYWSLLMIFGLAPFAPYIKAFTGIRYGPLMLDIGLLVILLGILADEVIQHKLITWADLGIFLFMLLGAVQVFNPLGPGFSYAVEGYRLLVWQAVGYLLGRRMVTTRRQVKQLVVVLCVVVTIVAIYGIKQFFLPSALDDRIIFSTSGDPSTYTSLGQRRAFSTMSSPAHLALFLVAMILLCVGLLNVARPRRWLIFQIAIMGLALVLTIIRTAWIGLSVGLGLTALLQAVERRNLVSVVRQLVPWVVVVVIVGYTLSKYLPDFAITRRFYSLADISTDYNFQLRVNSWPQTILPAILANPLGYGVGSDNVTRAARFYSHNGYFYVLIELGIPGLVLAMTILAGCLFRSWKILLQLTDPFLRIISRWILSFWGAMLVMATVGALFEVYPITLYAWFFLGLVNVFPELEKQGQAQNELALRQGTCDA